MSSYYTDFYGRSRGGQDFTSPADIPMPYEISSTSETDAGSGNKTVVRYTRFSGGTGKVAMWRETTIFAAQTNDILSFKHEFAIAKWADKDSDNTIAWVPINDCWDYKQKH